MVWEQISFTKKDERDIDKSLRETRKKTKFLADENISPELVLVLRSRGVKIKTAVDCGLVHRDDKDIFSYAFKHRLVILTHDTDYLEFRDFPFNRNPGVVIIPGGSGNTGSRNIAVERMLNMFSWQYYWIYKTTAHFNGPDEVVLYTQGDSTRFLYKNDDVLSWNNAS